MTQKSRLDKIELTQNEEEVRMILWQAVPVPDPGQDPWPWVAFLAVSALGFMFFRYDKARDELVKAKDEALVRSEKREGDLVASNAKSTELLKEQSAATLQAATIAEQAFQMGKMTHDILVSAAEENRTLNREAINKIDAIFSELTSSNDLPPQRRGRANDQ